MVHRRRADMTGSARRLAKRIAERALVALGAPRLLRAVGDGDAVVLAYHNIVPEGEPAGGDPSLHLPRADFAAQLDLLARSHRVVELATLLREGGDDGTPLAAITIDDAYRGAMTAGLAELEARGLPCTVFVAPDLLGVDATWWDALAPAGPEPLPGPVREELLTTARGRTGEVFRIADRHGLERRPQPTHAGIVGEDELAGAVDRKGVTVGSHAWSHPNLPELGEDELEEELVRPLAWLRERFGGSVVPWLSLPYGRSSDRVVEAAVGAGHEGVLDLSRRLLRAGEAGRTAPRVNVPAGITPEGFLLRASGL